MSHVPGTDCGWREGPSDLACYTVRFSYGNFSHGRLSYGRFLMEGYLIEVYLMEGSEKNVNVHL